MVAEQASIAHYERQSFCTLPAAAEVWTWLGEIADPEIPVLSITDLGIVRDVQASDDRVIITITPTYSGCPAMGMIAEEIRRVVKEHGIENLQLVTKLSPPWTTDWLSEDAKQRLHDYGIAPPPGLAATGVAGPSFERSLVQIEAAKPACPRCGSVETKLVSRFGSTPCKAHYQCLSCLEPFDAFKRH